MAEQLGAEAAAVSTVAKPGATLSPSNPPLPIWSAHTRARAHTDTDTKHTQNISWCLLTSSVRQTCLRSSWPFLLIISGEQPMTG